jgi:2'-5' RNA ligase
LERVRCFIAVDIDSPELKAKLVDLERELEGLGCSLKLVEPENIHVTLRFLGEIPEGLVSDVARALDGLSAKPFKLTLKGLGAFPSALKPRVVWVGVSEGAAELAELHSQVESLIRPLGFRPEREPFVSHVTLARVKSSRGLQGLSRLIAERRLVELGSMQVEAVKLKRSTLTPRGPVYSDIYVKKLG